jgi:hypothetical protein
MRPTTDNLNYENEKATDMYSIQYLNLFNTYCANSRNKKDFYVYVKI